MRIDKKNRIEERLVLTAMIVDGSVLGRIAIKWNGNLFKTKWSNIIGDWCVKYYRKYEQPPLAQIESLYRTWAETNNDKETVRLVEKFLDSLSQEYETLQKESNSDYLLDIAGKYFNQVQLERLAEEIQNEIDLGKPEIANDKVVGFNKIELGVGEGIDIFQDRQAIMEAFSEKKESLIIYPGDLGKFFGDSLGRDEFISFMAPDKRGKSFWLQDIAFRGALQRKRVAYFEAGDNSRNQIMRRFMIKVAGRPLKAKTIKYPVRLKKIPFKNEVKIKTEERTYDQHLDWRFCWDKCQKILQKKIKSTQTYFKLSCHTNSSLSVAKIKSILQSWELEGWSPDIIVIDYADIMDMNHYGIEGRDRINETWKQLRGLSQHYHCLVVTATQSDAAAYSAKVIKQENFSDDKRKMAHITGMLGLNMTEEEKKKGITRLNWIVLREEEFNVSRCVYAAGCKDIGNVAILSAL